MESRELSFVESAKNVIFNVRYKLISYFEEYRKNSLMLIGDSVFVLGQGFKVTEENKDQVIEAVYQLFLRTAWLTYRSGFPKIYNQSNDSYVSDTGWGCMIRVGQMAFAEIMKEHLLLVNENYMLGIIELFNDCDETKPFSILNVARVAQKIYGLMPGDWYNPSQISYVLAALHHNRLESLQSLTFVIFNSGNLFYDEIAKKMLGNGASPCTCSNKTKGLLVCGNCHKAHRSVAVIALARIGLDYSEQKYLQVLNKMMEMSSFRGVIGGKPKKALYFIGRHNNEYIYLDPHFVQPAAGNIEEIKQSYFCDSFRKCKNTAIDSSLGICFYLRDLKEFIRFMHEMDHIKKVYASCFFLFVSERTPSYAVSVSDNEENESEDVVYQKL